jgi:hypothetical protein
MKFCFAFLAVVMIVALTPAAHATSANYNMPCLNSVNQPNCHVHVVAAGSSAQFLTSAIGADDFANSAAVPGTSCSFHWTGSNSGELFDSRVSEFEPGNVWIVWIASQDGATCATSTGNVGITDIWMDIQVDSTVGVRSFFAETATGFCAGGTEPNNDGHACTSNAQCTASGGGTAGTCASGDGDTVYVVASASSGLVSPPGLWPDGRADVSTLQAGGATNIPLAVGTDATGASDVHVNVGFTDIRGEDAQYATERAMDPITATRTGLGYGPETSEGTPILTSQGTGTRATPIAFATSGTDPITGLTVRNFTTVPLGAAPIIFVYNNAGASPNPVLNLKSGVGGSGAGRFKASYLFGGGTNGVACTTTSSAFGGNDVGGTPLHLYLREPLSGTMNTTEFNVFRTTGNTSGSQEVGVTPPGDNPLSAKVCAGGSGDRNRVVGNTESRNAVLNNANGLGYQFFAFANMVKYGGKTTYNYLTVDGVDPFGGSTLSNAAQTPPDCGGPCRTGGLDATSWNGLSFPNLRNGTYGVWSIYRWLTETASDYGDVFGPSHLALHTQNFVNTSVADFVPYCTGTDFCNATSTANIGQACANDAFCGGVAGSCTSDSLDLYRSHFNYTADEWQQAYTGDDGSVSACGDSLGGGAEAGGDVGGQIYGPFPVNGTMKWSSTLGHFTAVAPKFSTWYYGASAVGNTISIPAASNGPTFTISAETTTTLTVTPAPTGLTNGHTYSYTYDPQTPGVLGRKR